MDISQSIQNAMNQLVSDKAIFEKFEIPEYLSKYAKIDGNTKVFDYWYEVLAKLKNQVTSQLICVDDIVKRTKEIIQDQFDKCYVCAEDLRKAISKFDNFSVSQIRADIDIFSSKTSIVVLYKTKDGEFPEDFADYNDFLKAIFEVQERSNEQHKPNNYYFTSLFAGDDICIDLIKQDFPISIRQ